ncbi:uncharacterized protein LOC114841192 [Diachasma alloeum]|uniref:uncharacterized protein LOC114841192 n=1 Tax=Diachasma alloeum TaxID=454923 RepID=UPI0010FB9C51|nr:uncharacterized protein LOC114841192 [Diachasma alloeum]
MSNDVDTHMAMSPPAPELKPIYIDIGVQTDPVLNEEEIQEEIPVIFLCWQDSALHEASTQASIILKAQSRPRVIIPSQKKTRTIRVGPDKVFRSGFLGYENIKDDRTMKQLAGITLSFFHILLTFIEVKAEGQPAYYKTLDSSNRLLRFLMKMKLGLTFGAIGYFFKVSSTTASTIFHEILVTLHVKMKSWIFWPSREAIKETMPSTFRNYPTCRAIIDYTELPCDTPPTLEQRVQMYSSYKCGFTIKYLIGISPSGMITFISKGYGGKCTDGFIVNDSIFLGLVEPGDQIMADKGFPQIKIALLERQCVLVMPPMAVNPQFSREEVLEGYSIASVRIHVERAIQRVKIFGILRHINVELFKHIDKIMFIACVLANNKEPILRPESNVQK